MREIKFRAWDKKKKEWIATQVYIEIDIGIPWWFDDSDEVIEEAENIILVQYTGLKDKDGKKIYEGDIIECDFLGRREKGVIRFERDGWEWKFSSSLKVTSGLLFVKENYNPKIIGNIHENPKLLED